MLMLAWGDMHMALVCAEQQLPVPGQRIYCSQGQAYDIFT